MRYIVYVFQERARRGHGAFIPVCCCSQRERAEAERAKYEALGKAVMVTARKKQRTADTIAAFLVALGILLLIAYLATN